MALASDALPGLLHPALQAHVSAGLSGLQGGGAGLVPAQGLGEVGGVLGGQATGGREAGGTLGVAQGVALCSQRKNKNNCQRNTRWTSDEIQPTLKTVMYSVLILNVFAP